MKLKTRLRISFIAMIAAPLILLALFMVLFGNMKIQSLEEEYGVEFSLVSFVNSVQTINESNISLWEEMKAQAARDPDQFLSLPYLRKLNEQMQDKLSFLLLIRDGEIYYQGTNENIHAMIPLLPGYGDYDPDVSENGSYIGGKVKAMVMQMDLDFSDGSLGSAYIITTAKAVFPRLRVMILEFLIGLGVVFMITAAILTYWIDRGINAPLIKLKDAANQITNGNLDFTLDASGNDEISDLTRDFEQMRKRLAQSEKEKQKYDRENRELIRNISHDLKTPITAVKGYVEGIMDGVADTPEKMNRYIRTVYNKANEMDHLIDELTFYSRIDANRIPYHFIILNTAEFFGDCAEETGIELEQNGIRFSYVNHTDPETEILADPEQLKRVISNIISNSVKYTEKGKGKIELRVTEAGDFIEVALEDNGKGIEEEYLERIFDRFFRTDESRSSTEGGSGIGLSIVRKIIEDHGGQIRAESSPGEGTTIFFRLRKYSAAAPAAELQ